MREGARRAAIAAGALAFGGALWAGGRALPDPVGEAAVAACAAAVERAHEDAAVEVLSSRDERAPAPSEEWGPSGPAGDTLHAVSIEYAWRGPDGAGGPETARCAYVERASEAGFDPARLRVQDAAGRP